MRLAKRAAFVLLVVWPALSQAQCPKTPRPPDPPGFVVDYSPHYHLQVDAVSPRGALIAAHTGDGAIWLFSVPDRIRHPLDRCGAEVTSATFSSDSRTLVVADAEGQIRFFDTTTLTLKKALRDGERVERVALFDSDRKLISIHNRGLTVWDISNSKRLVSISQLGAHSWFDDAAADRAVTRIAASGTGIQGVVLWNRSDWQPADLAGAPEGTAMCFSPDGREIIVAEEDGSLAVYNSRSRQRMRRFGSGVKLSYPRVWFHPRRPELMVVFGDDDEYEHTVMLFRRSFDGKIVRRVVLPHNAVINELGTVVAVPEDKAGYSELRVWATNRPGVITTFQYRSSIDEDDAQ